MWEEGDTSHVCQMYDQEPAKQDKVVQRSGVSILREAAQLPKGVVDQWGLVAIALMAVRNGVENPGMWVRSAIKVNLHPKHRRAFGVWLGLGPYFANCFAKFGGYFEEKIVLRNMRNIVPNRAKFISFWAPEKNSREMWLHRAKFSSGGSKFSYGGLVTCHWPFRFYSTATHLAP